MIGVTVYLCPFYVTPPFRRVRENLDRQTGWIRGKEVKLEAAEITSAPFYQLLKPDNRGHTFYESD